MQMRTDRFFSALIKELYCLNEQTVFTPIGAKQCGCSRCLRHLSEQCLFTPF